MNIDVLLVDDYKMTIQGIAALLKNYSDINVVGVLHSGEEAVVFCKKNAPDSSGRYWPSICRRPPPPVPSRRVRSPRPRKSALRS